MSEAWYRTASLCYGIAVILLNAGMTAAWFRPFLRKKRTAFMVFLANAAVMLFFFLVRFTVATVLAYGCGAAAVFLISSRCERENIRQKLFLSVTAYLLTWIAAGLGALPWDLLSNRVLFSASMPQGSTRQFIVFLLFDAARLLTRALLLFLMILGLHRAYTEKQALLEAGELYLLLSPYLAILAGEHLSNFLLTSYEKDMASYVWYAHPAFYAIRALFQAAAYAAILTGIIADRRLYTARRNETGQMVLAGQLRELRLRTAAEEERFREARRLRHDFRNHLQVLDGLYAAGETAEARTYLTALSADMAKIAPAGQTGNPVTDLLLSAKEAEAAAEGITLTADFHYPPGGTVEAYEISILLSNALSNAFEAAKESAEKTVSVRSYLKEEIFFLEVQNSFDGTLLLDPASGRPVPGRAADEGHGFGFSNMADVAARHYGTVTLSQSGAAVTLTAMLVIS